MSSVCHAVLNKHLTGKLIVFYKMFNHEKSPFAFLTNVPLKLSEVGFNTLRFLQVNPLLDCVLEGWMISKWIICVSVECPLALVKSTCGPLPEPKVSAISLASPLLLFLPLCSTAGVVMSLARGLGPSQFISWAEQSMSETPYLKATNKVTSRELLKTSIHNQYFILITIWRPIWQLGLYRFSTSMHFPQNLLLPNHSVF